MKDGKMHDGRGYDLTFCQYNAGTNYKLAEITNYYYGDSINSISMTFKNKEG